MSETKDLFAPAEAIGRRRRRRGDRAAGRRRARIASSAASTRSPSPQGTGSTRRRAIAAFLHAARIGLFDMSWNVLCPGCGGVLDSNATLKTVQKDEYVCALCAAGYRADARRDGRGDLHGQPARAPDRRPHPHELPLARIFAADLLGLRHRPARGLRGAGRASSCSIDIELPPGEKASLSLQLPAEFIIVFDPVTHAAQFIDVKGEPTRGAPEPRRSSSTASTSTARRSRCGRARCASRWRTGRTTRVLPTVFIAGDALHDLLRRRRPFLTAKRLLSNQTFRDLYRTDTLDVDQRLKITSLTFLFTDLRGSTELYERVGDLVAFDLVRAHFQVLQRDRRGGGGRRGEDDRRCGDGDVPDARTGRSPRRCACAKRCWS